jgi:hypothetical protein
MTPMVHEIIEIECTLCACHFNAADLKEDDILCSFCGHSLDEDHAEGPATSEPETAAAV